MRRIKVPLPSKEDMKGVLDGSCSVHFMHNLVPTSASGGGLKPGPWTINLDLQTLNHETRSLNPNPYTLIAGAGERHGAASPVMKRFWSAVGAIPLPSKERTTLNVLRTST